MPQWVSILTEFIAPSRAEERKRYVPPLDGPLLRNSRLDVCSAMPGPALVAPTDVLPMSDGSLLVSSGEALVRCGPGDFASRHVLARLDGPAGPLALTAEGNVLVCVGGHGVVRVGPSGDVSPVLSDVDGAPLVCPTGIAVDLDGTVYVAEGTRDRLPGEWVWDLMESSSDGRLLALDQGSGRPTVLLDGLSYPNGIALSPAEDSLWFTTAWDHSIRRLDMSGARSSAVVQSNMAGYPAQIHPRAAGGYWVALFALRTQLVEFVLREDKYRREMMRNVPPEYWIRPALRGLNSGLEPLQGGGIKKLGESKPWAPPRSYGFVMRIDADGVPLESLQSPADGDRHGVWSAREADGRLYISCTGADAVLIADEGQ